MGTSQKGDVNKLNGCSFYCMMLC